MTFIEPSLGWNQTAPVWLPLRRPQFEDNEPLKLDLPQRACQPGNSTPEISFKCSFLSRRNTWPGLPDSRNLNLYHCIMAEAKTELKTEGLPPLQQVVLPQRVSRVSSAFLAPEAGFFVAQVEEHSGAEWPGAEARRRFVLDRICFS